MKNDKDILLIDSSCPLCNKSVAFIIKSGGENKYKFMSLYSQDGKRYLKKYGFPDNYNKSVVLIHRNKAFVKSEVLLKIAESLNGIYFYLTWLKLIPRRLRNWMYDLIAKHRHSIIS